MIVAIIFIIIVASVTCYSMCKSSAEREKMFEQDDFWTSVQDKEKDI